MGILRELFGPSKEDIWKQLATELDGDFQKGNFWKGDKIDVLYKDWFITLNTYSTYSKDSSTTYTCMRGAFTNVDGFRFTVYRKSIFNGIGKFFGMQDIQIGDHFFDEAYIIKSNDISKVRVLFKNRKLKQLIKIQPKLRLSLQDDNGWFNNQFPQGVDELFFERVGVMKDLTQLRNLFELFAEVLNNLCHLDSGFENDPNL